MASTVRISKPSHQALRDLAEREQVSLQTVLERAIESYRRNRFLDALNATYEALRSDPEKWTAELNERNEWSGTSIDGDTE